MELIFVHCWGATRESKTTSRFTRKTKGGATNQTWAGVELACSPTADSVHLKRWGKVARPEGLEPPTLCFEGRCSIQLSYERAMRQF